MCSSDLKNIIYQFYRKEMANFLVLMKASAMPTRMKRVCLIQEVIRILRNTKRQLPDRYKERYLIEFSLRMKDSGYSASFRKEVIESGIVGYKRQLQRQEEGICPLHRPKGYMAEVARKKKELQRTADRKRTRLNSSH